MAFLDPPERSRDTAMIAFALLVVGLVVAAVPTLNLSLDKVFSAFQ